MSLESSTTAQSAFSQELPISSGYKMRLISDAAECENASINLNDLNERRSELGR